MSPDGIYMPIGDVSGMPESNRPWKHILLAFVPLILCLFSFVVNDAGVVRDCGMVSLTLLSVYFLINELKSFMYRFGIGGILVFGGVLIWFSYDYFTNYLGRDPNSLLYSQIALSRAALVLAVLFLGMIIGLRVSITRPVERIMSAMPEPDYSGVYLIAIIFMLLLGLFPYYEFSLDPFWITIYKSMTSMRAGDYAAWTVGRTGNLNYSWGGYVPLLIQIGGFSGVLGVFYATFITKKIFLRVIGYSIWIFWCLIGFGTGARGGVVFQMLPAVFFVFVSNYIRAMNAQKRYSLKAYSASICLLLATLAVVQFQSFFRTTRMDMRDWRQVDITEVQGNQMFTEGLLAAELVPDRVPFFKNDFFGEGAFRVVPDLIWSFIIHPIPRALWYNKPIDSAWEWYNNAVTGQDGRNSTTIAPGLGMSNYMRYGFGGVFIFGVLFGSLCRSCERVVHGAFQRPMHLLVGMAFGVWLFRCYRDTLIMGDLWILIFTFGILAAVILILRHLAGNAKYVNENVVLSSDKGY